MPKIDLEKLKQQNSPVYPILFNLFSLYNTKMLESISDVAKRKQAIEFIISCHEETQKNPTASVNEIVNNIISNHNQNNTVTSGLINKFIADTSTLSMAAGSFAIAARIPTLAPYAVGLECAAGVATIAAGLKEYLNNVSTKTLSYEELNFFQGIVLEKALTNSKFKVVLQNVLAKQNIPLSYGEIELKDIANSAFSIKSPKFEEFITQHITDALETKVSDIDVCTSQSKDVANQLAISIKNMITTEIKEVTQALEQSIDDKKSENEIKEKKREYLSTINKINKTTYETRSAVILMGLFFDKVLDAPDKARDITVTANSIIDIIYASTMYCVGASAGGPITLAATIVMSINNVINHFLGNQDTSLEIYLKQIARELKEIKEYIIIGINHLNQQQQVIIKGIFEIQKVLQENFANIRSDLQNIKVKLDEIEWHLVDRVNEQKRKKLRDKLNNIQDKLMLLFANELSSDMSNVYNMYLSDIYHYAMRISTNNVFSGATEKFISKEILIKEINERQYLEYSFGLFQQIAANLSINIQPNIIFYDLPNPTEWSMASLMFLQALERFPPIKNSYFTTMVNNLIKKGRQLKEAVKILTSSHILVQLSESYAKVAHDLSEKIIKQLTQNLEQFAKDFKITDNKLLLTGFHYPNIKKIKDIPVGASGNDKSTNINSAINELNTNNYYFLRNGPILNNNRSPHFYLFSIESGLFNPLEKAEQIGLIKVEDVANSNPTNGYGLLSARNCMVTFLKGKLKDFKFVIQKSRYSSNPQIIIYDDLYTPLVNGIGNWAQEIQKFPNYEFFPKILAKEANYLGKVCFVDLIYYQLNTYLFEEKACLIRKLTENLDTIDTIASNFKNQFIELELIGSFSNLISTLNNWCENRAFDKYASFLNNYHSFYTKEHWLNFICSSLMYDFSDKLFVTEIDNRLVTSLKLEKNEEIIEFLSAKFNEVIQKVILEYKINSINIDENKSLPVIDITLQNLMNHSLAQSILETGLQKSLSATNNILSSSINSTKTLLNQTNRYSNRSKLFATSNDNTSNRITDIETVLIEACKSGNVQQARECITNGANINVRDPASSNETPLYHSISTCSLELVEMLLANKADIDLANTCGHTPLHRAGTVGSKTIVYLLVKNGGNVNLQDKNGLTPLHWAIIGNNKNSLLALLEQGADLSITNIKGETPLNLAINDNKEELTNIIQEFQMQQQNQNKLQL